MSTVQHTILTFIASIVPARLAELEALLADIQPDPVTNPVVPFGLLVRLHFASLVVLPADRQHGYGPSLVFENNFDGPLTSYVDELLLKIGPGLHRIFSHCVGYPIAETWDPAALRQYLMHHIVWPHAAYVGTPGRSLARIRRESDLYQQLEAFLDGVEVGPDAAQPPGVLRQRIQEFVTHQAPWAARTVPRLSLRQRYLPKAQIAVTLLSAVVVVRRLRLARQVGKGLLALGLLWLVMLRYQESKDAVQRTPPKHEHLQQLLNRENRTRIVQNHMANLSYVKPGLFRRATLRAVLWAANLGARMSIQGELSGIPSIHFAHWSLIDHGRRLLFLTNYDGSWENYLDDFIDKASPGLSAIWSNTEGFPKASFLGIFPGGGGSRDGVRFKAIARDKQVYSNVWYSAYPDLTVQSIDQRSAMVEEMFRPLDAARVRRWLWRF